MTDSDPWHAAEFGPMRGLSPNPQPDRFATLMHGMSTTDYMSEYNHGSHLADEVGTFRSDCPGCQRHLAEAFGPVVQQVIKNRKQVRIPADATPERLIAWAQLSMTAATTEDDTTAHLYEAIEYLISAIERTTG